MIYFSKNFNPSKNNVVNARDLEKLLFGNIKPNCAENTFFVVNSSSLLSTRLPNSYSCNPEFFNQGEWYGKFAQNGISRIVVPYSYELLIQPTKKQISLHRNPYAMFRGVGSFQGNKCLNEKVIPTPIDFDELKEIVKSKCSSFQYSESLDIW